MTNTSYMFKLLNKLYNASNEGVKSNTKMYKIVNLVLLVQNGDYMFSFR